MPEYTVIIRYILYCEVNCEVDFFLTMITQLYYNENTMKEWTGKEIRQLRERFRLTQKALGDLLGVTRVYIMLLEKEVKRGASKTLKLLLAYVEKDLTEKDNEREKEVTKHGKGTQEHTPRKGNL
jgi:DNA-binding XRE family transcriptional regulator